MNPDQGTELRSGRVINSSSETSSPADPDIAQANSNDSDTNDNSDISSQLSEIKESYERRINELHQEFSQLKDLMMAIVSKNNNESQPSNSKGPSKPTQQQGFDIVSSTSHFKMKLMKGNILAIASRLERKREKLNSPLPRSGRRISSSAFLSRRLSDTISP